MPEVPDGDISSKIKILSDEPAQQGATLHDPNLDNLIQVGQTETTIRRVQKEMPRPENTTLLGERDNNFEEVFIDGTTLVQMTEYLRGDLHVELGGGLIGYFCEDPRSGVRFAQVTGFAADSQGTSRGGTYTFTPDSWTEMNSFVSQRARGESILGWVHSHPLNYPPIPTGADRDQFIMQHIFGQPEQITLILGRGGEYDNRYGLWRWQDGSAQMQKGIKVVGDNSRAIRNISMYSSGEKQQELMDLIKVGETKEERLRLTPDDFTNTSTVSNSEPRFRITKEDLR